MMQLLKPVTFYKIYHLAVKIEDHLSPSQQGTGQRKPMPVVRVETRLSRCQNCWPRPSNDTITELVYVFVERRATRTL